MALLESSEDVLNMKLDFYNLSNSLISRTTFNLTNEYREFKLPFKNRINVAPLTYEMTFTYNDKPAGQYSGTVKKASRQKYIVSGGTITNEDVCFGFYRNQLCKSETYNFENSNEYITIDDHSKLDLSSYSFTYSPIYNFKSDEMYLEIIDYENIYPNLDKNEDNLTIRVPLKTKIVSARYTFDYDASMYVNPQTLEMSTRQISGYEQSNALYVPIFSQSKLQNNEIKIHLIGAGFDKSDITIPLKYIFDSNYFGFCDDSDYCIHGGIRE